MKAEWKKPIRPDPTLNLLQWIHAKDRQDSYVRIKIQKGMGSGEGAVPEKQHKRLSCVLINRVK